VTARREASERRIRPGVLGELSDAAPRGLPSLPWQGLASDSASDEASSPEEEAAGSRLSGSSSSEHSAAYSSQ